jgi:hypothetical protein
MNTIIAGRAPFNELASLLKRLNPEALRKVVSEFPEFAEEVIRGPDAGDADGNRSSALARGAFAVALCEEAVLNATTVAGSVLANAKKLDSARLASVVLGGVFGISTLTSLGFASGSATKISAIATSFIALLNSAVAFFSRKYSAARIKRAAELNRAATALSIMGNELTSAIAGDVPTDEIVKTMARCNKIAMEVNKESDLIIFG